MKLFIFRIVLSQTSLAEPFNGFFSFSSLCSYQLEKIIIGSSLQTFLPQLLKSINNTATALRCGMWQIMTK